MAEVLAKTTFSSVIHNNEVCDEIVKWGNANGYPVTKAKLQNKLDAYVGFSPEYMILAKRLPAAYSRRLGCDCRKLRTRRTYHSAQC